MKNLNFGKISVIAACLMAVAAAGAQSVRHDFMDARGARADIARLKVERRMARRAHNWGKVDQDNRLIAKDRMFIRKDAHKIARAEG